MTLNTLAPLSAIVTMLGTISGVQQVVRGVPESLTHQVWAWTTVGGQTVISEEFRELARFARYLVAFGYRVGGDQTTAENTIATAIDEFILQFHADRAASTGLFAHATTQVEDGEIDLSLADNPEYSVYAGQENRVYPLLITVTQRQAD